MLIQDFYKLCIVCRLQEKFTCFLNMLFLCYFSNPLKPNKLVTLLKTVKTSFVHYFMAILDSIQFQCNFLCLQLKLVILRNEHK
jgi:hypothetical protein